LCEAARLQAYASRLAHFRYTEVLSNPSPAWSGKRGYLTEHFDLAELRDRSADMYVCGPPANGRIHPAMAGGSGT